MNTQPSQLRASTRGLVALVLLLSALLPVAATAAPVASPCAPGAVYDQACDVDHDGDVDVMDIQLAAGHFNQSGTFNPSDNNHNHLGQMWTGSNNPLKIDGSYGAPDYAPLALSNSSGHGLRIPSASTSGVFIDSVGGHGVVVNSAAMDGMFVGSAANGVRVTNAANNGMYVDSAVNGVYVNSATSDGIFVCRTGNAVSCSSRDSNNGLEIGYAEDFGVFVSLADYSGVHVEWARFTGVSVGTAGGAGVDVGTAGFTGVSVFSAGTDGVIVDKAGNPSNLNCDYTSSNGFEICGADGEGLYVGYAGGNGVNVAGENLAGYFGGTIQVTGVGGCNGCLLTTFGVNAGNTSLAPGDIVSLSGLQASGVDSVPMLMEIASANDGDAVVGVVQGWAELVTEEGRRPSEIGKRLVPREGAAEPGQYVTIAYSGLTQVKATGPIAQGSKLAAGTDGTARALRTVIVEGVELAENAAVIGTALESLDGEGLVWVLVNVQ